MSLLCNLVFALLAVGSASALAKDTGDAGNRVHLKRSKILIEVPIEIVIDPKTEAELGRKDIKKMFKRAGTIRRPESELESKWNDLLNDARYKNCYRLKIDVRFGFHFQSDGPSDGRYHELHVSGTHKTTNREIDEGFGRGGAFGSDTSGANRYTAGLKALLPSVAPGMPSHGGDLHNLVVNISTFVDLAPLLGSELLGRNGSQLNKALGEKAEAELERQGQSLGNNDCIRARYERRVRTSGGGAGIYEHLDASYTVSLSKSDRFKGSVEAVHRFHAWAPLQDLRHVVFSENEFDADDNDYSISWNAQQANARTTTYRDPWQSFSWSTRDLIIPAISVRKKDIEDGFHQSVYEAQGVRVVWNVTLKKAEDAEGGEGETGASTGTGGTEPPPRSDELPCCGSDWPTDPEGLVNTLKGEDIFGRRFAASVLGDVPPISEQAVGALRAALNDEDFLVRRAAATSLGKAGPSAKGATDTLRALLQDKESTVRVAAAEAIWRISGNVDRSLPLLKKELSESADLNARIRAARALGKIGAPARGAIADLKQMTAAENPASLRIAAAEAMFRIENDASKTLPVLSSLCASPVPQTRIDALRAMATLSGQASPAAPQIVQSLMQPLVDRPEQKQDDDKSAGTPNRLNPQQILSASNLPGGNIASGFSVADPRQRLKLIDQSFHTLRNILIPKEYRESLKTLEASADISVRSRALRERAVFPL